MKKILLKIIAMFTAIVLIFSFQLVCLCEENILKPDEILNNQLNELNVDELQNAIDDETKKNMEQFLIKSPHLNEIKNFSIEKFFNFIFQSAIGILKQPLFIFCNCLAVILIAALFENFKPNENIGNLNTIIGLITTLCTCAVVIVPIIDCITSVSKTIKNFQNFMFSFIPIFASTLAMNFKTATSIGYSSTLFFIAQFISATISNVLLPITGTFLAFSIVGSLNSNFQISAITSTVKKIVIFILVFMVTVFMGLFSIQTSIAVSSDGVAIKTAKFVSNTFIPIIGGTLGDALGSVVGSLNLIKSVVGGFGILVCLTSFVPPILKIGFFLTSISLIGALSKSFKINLVENTMTSTKDCLSILLSFLISYGILMISSTSIILNLTSK